MHTEKPVSNSTTNRTNLTGVEEIHLHVMFNNRKCYCTQSGSPYDKENQEIYDVETLYHDPDPSVDSVRREAVGESYKCRNCGWEC